MTLTPYEWQVADQEELARNNYVGVAVIERGGGKTLFAVLAGKNSGAQVKLVVAPQGTHRGHGDGYEWFIRELTGEQVYFLNNGTKSGKRAFSDLEFGVPGWYIITPQLFSRIKNWESYDIDMVIIDEIHLLAQGKQSKKALLGIDKNHHGLTKARFKIGMSGTPVRNKFENWYTIMRWLYPEMDGYHEIADFSLTRWKDHWCRIENNRFAEKNCRFCADPNNTWEHDHYTVLGEKAPGGLVSNIPCYVQHYRRANCCQWHPNGFLPLDEPQIIIEQIDLLPAQKRAIDQIEEQQIAWLQENPLVIELPVTAQLRIRQITLGVPTVRYFEDQDGNTKSTLEFEEDCASPKLDRALEILEDQDGEACVVFTSSQRFASVAVNRFSAAGHRAFEWSGRVSQKQREEYMQRFQAGEFQVAVVVIAAGGTGVSGFQKRAATEIWLDRDLDPTSNLQAEARLDRLGQTRQVQRFFIHDSLGRDEGVLSEQTRKIIALNESNRKKVALDMAHASN